MMCMLLKTKGPIAFVFTDVNRFLGEQIQVQVVPCKEMKN